MAPLLFLLGGVVEQHLVSWTDRLPKSMAEILCSLYVDGLIPGGPTVTRAKKLKSDAISIFSEGGFQLHKWDSNAPQLELNSQDPTAENKDTYAKLQLDSDSGEENKLLGKFEDTLIILFPAENAKLTKRAILERLPRIYDPLGLVSPTSLHGKFLYRQACELKQAWDTPLPDGLAVRWRKWESALPSSALIKRALAPHREPIEGVELLSFGDASGHGVATAVYAVVSQSSGPTQGLLAAKAWLTKQRLMIPRLELVAGHMAGT